MQMPAIKENISAPIRKQNSLEPAILVNKPDRKKKRSKTEDVKQKKKLIDNLNNEDVEFAEERQKVCKLCNRELPIFFYGNEEQVKRLPERALTSLLREMKEDLENKRNYLKTLRVSAKFIQPCSCKNQDVHTYCMTALIIHKKRIYCEKCG